MDVKELGKHTKELVVAVEDGDYVAIFGKLGAGHQALKEFLDGFQDTGPRGSTLSPTAHQYELLGGMADDLDAACGKLVDNPPRHAVRGFNPAWIPLIIQSVQAFAALLRAIRDNKPGAGPD